jgi:hypothetical protein
MFDHLRCLQEEKLPHGALEGLGRFAGDHQRARRELLHRQVARLAAGAESPEDGAKGLCQFWGVIKIGGMRSAP